MLEANTYSLYFDFFAFFAFIFALISWFFLPIFGAVGDFFDFSGTVLTSIAFLIHSGNGGTVRWHQYDVYTGKIDYTRYYVLASSYFLSIADLFMWWFVPNWIVIFKPAFWQTIIALYYYSGYVIGNTVVDRDS